MESLILLIALPALTFFSFIYSEAIILLDKHFDGIAKLITYFSIVIVMSVVIEFFYVICFMDLNNHQYRNSFPFATSKYRVLWLCSFPLSLSNIIRSMLNWSRAVAMSLSFFSIIFIWGYLLVSAS